MIEKSEISNFILCIPQFLLLILSFQNDVGCGFYHFLISSDPCGQFDNTITVEAFNNTTIQKIIEVPSFSNISITAYSEEDSCLCQTLSEY